jgi:filamentous hemagglutinin family protein
MNRIYRLVWSRVNHAWVAVAENAKGHGKSISARKLVAAAAALIGGALLAPSVYAADAANATVTGGAGSVSQSGATTTINQSSQRLAIDWTNLSTAANEALVFKQPNASAIALNRITGSSPSTLLGSLTANGQVYILNPNGVLFGAGAQVNVGGLVASTLNMSSADFMNGSSTFTKDPNAAGTVDNQGTLTAANGGYIALLSGTVRNEGTIDAPLGTALLAAGDKVTLNVNNGSLIGYSIDQGDLNALIENKQLIRADGGQVLMVAKALDKLSTAVINNTGIIEARTVQNKNGHILLLGDMDVGQVNVGGTLDASAPTTGDGGKIETSAAHVKVADGTIVTTLAANGLTGSWLIDPIEFTIAASGGDMTGAEVDAELAMNNLGLSSGGDINVNDTISWNAATTLTLNADGNININQSITASNAGGGLTLLYGQNAVNAGNTATYNVNAPINLQAGNNFSTKLGSNGSVIQYTVITSLGNPNSTTRTDLQGINGNLNGDYVLGSDIDATATSGWNSGAGFVPIGNGNPMFSGIFDGLGHVISNLKVNFSSNNYIGLFGINNGTIRNVGLAGNSITGASYVGGLVGLNYGSGTVSNSFASGSVVYSYGKAGGLVGENYGVINNSFATGTVQSVGNALAQIQTIGGLVGQNYGTVNNSHASTNVNGEQYVGGLVGRNSILGNGIWGFLGQATAGKISNSYATGTVTAGLYSGGLAGINYGTISGSYAGAQVASNTGGGLVGINSGTIRNSYAAGDVTSFTGGGLVGRNDGIISDSYATGSVTGTEPGAVGGGLVGINGSFGITDSFWNTQMSGINIGAGVGSVAGITPINNAQASQLSTFADAGWDIGATGGTGTVWRIYDGESGPLLRSFLTPITVTGDPATRTYDGTTDTAATYSTNINGATLSGSLDYVTSKNVGAYFSAGGTLAQSGLYSTNQLTGYDISYADTSLAINQAAVTLFAAPVDKTYDGTTTAFGAVIIGSGTIFSGDSLSGSLAYTDKNVGAGDKTVTAGGMSIDDGNGGNNYNITYVDNTTSTITQANLQLTAGDASKAYDGGTSVASDSVSVTGGQIFNGDSIIDNGAFAYTDKNAGSGKTVTVSGATVGDGANNGNYNITYVNNTTSTITQANLELTVGSVTKTYDGGTSVASDSLSVTGGQLFGGDSIIDNGSFAFTDKNAGSGNKTVTAGGATVGDGTNNGNYNITYVNNTASTINKADLTVSATGVDKVYDGSTNATVTYTDNRIAGDSLNVTGTADFADKNAGNDKAITVGGISLGGADAGNYNPIFTGSTTADITPASLTIIADADAKSDDGRPFAGGNGVTINGLVNGDTMADLMGTLGYGGSSQGATAIGNYVITPDGLNSANYNISFVDGVLSITALSQASAALGGSALEQAYDSVQKTIADIVDGDGNAPDKPGSVGNNNTGAPSAEATDKITPRLSLAGCGMSMPAGAGSSCQ